MRAERKRGLSAEAAIYEACRERFRPILMTTLAALLGAVPMIIATGPGSDLRRPLGITIAGGLIVSQVLTLYTTPGDSTFFSINCIGASPASFTPNQALPHEPVTRVCDQRQRRKPSARGEVCFGGEWTFSCGHGATEREAFRRCGP